MAITNGYCTLADVKAYLDITSANATDDTVLEALTEHASRLIDAETRRTFYARTETHYYDVPSGGSLYIDDDDLLTVTTLTNGDGVVIAAASYKLYPLNSSPKWEIRLLPSSNVYWAWSTAGDISAAITLVGTWGRASTTPADIHGACLQIISNIYKHRFGENNTNDSVITAGGVVISPVDIPTSALRILQSYRRLI